MPAVPLYPEIPPPVELDPQAKKRLLAGIKTVMTRLQAQGVLKAGVDYADMLGKPQSLLSFIEGFRGNRALAADLLVDAAGRPASGDTAVLSCGLSLAQICQMLVYTCAKRIFVDADAETKPPQPAKKLTELFRRKTPPSRDKSEGERKLAELKPYLAFDWQLPLLKYYYFFFDRHQITELGREILLLRDQLQLEMVAAFEMPKLKAARRLAQDQFPEVLINHPGAIEGLARAPDMHFALFHDMCGPRVWAFYARDLDYIDDVTEVDRAVLRAIGPLLADTSFEVVDALSRLQADRIEQMLVGFRTVFRADLPDILSDPGFGRQTLLPLVQRFLGLDWDANQFIRVVELKCTAMKPLLDAWLERKRAGIPAELPDSRP
jgi:hypothetical protein